MRWILCAAALALSSPSVSAAPQAPPAADTLREETRDPALEQAARAVVDAVTGERTRMQAPPCLWSEILAVAVREHLEHLIAKGWRGGPAPEGVIALKERLAGLHGCPVEIAEGSHVVAPLAFDAVVAARACLQAPGAQACTDADRILAAAAVREVDGTRCVLLAVALGDHKPTVEIGKVLLRYVAESRAKDPKVRHAALRTLGQCKIAEALPALREGLRHADPTTRLAATEALAHVVSRGAVPPLLVALEDADAAVRGAAARSLAAIVGSAEFGDDATKWRAWWAEGALKFACKLEWAVPSGTASQALPDLLAEWKAATEARDLIRRVGVLTALRDHPERTDRTAQALMLAALNDPAREVKFEAIRCVAAQKMRAAIQPLVDLVNAQATKDKQVAQGALLGLAQIGDLKALDHFTKSAWSAKDGEVLWTRIFAIRYLRSPASADWLVNLFTAAGAEGISHYAQVIGESLEFLSGERHGKDGAAWKKWWKQAKGAGWKPEPLPDDYKVEYLFGALPGGGK